MLPYSTPTNFLVNPDHNSPTALWKSPTKWPASLRPPEPKQKILAKQSWVITIVHLIACGKKRQYVYINILFVDYLIIQTNRNGQYKYICKETPQLGRNPIQIEARAYMHPLIFIMFCGYLPDPSRPSVDAQPGNPSRTCTNIRFCLKNNQIHGSKG